MRLYGNGIIVIHCEEVDQFDGERELRSVTQSTMRGGDKFWDFRSFNPPISQNNWANEFADVAETREDTLVIRNSYKDVPEEWLGPAFFDEAETLKEINPRAYEHEYLGIPVGMGGNVFENACDLDMEQLVEVYDFDGSVTDKIPLYKTFDKIYNGIDWGWRLKNLALV